MIPIFERAAKALAFASALFWVICALPVSSGEAPQIPMPAVTLHPPVAPASDYAEPLAEALDDAAAGNYERAIAGGERSLKMATQQLGADNDTVLHIQDILADFYLAGNENDRARRLIEQTLRVENEPFDANAIDLVIATKLGGLARSLEFADPPKYAQATPFLERALATREKVLGYDSPYVAASLYDLANNMVFLGKFAKGEALYKHAVGVCEKDLARNKNNLVPILNDMALMYVKQGRSSSAEPLLKRALALAQRSPKADDSVIAEVSRHLNKISNEKSATDQ